MQKIQHQAWRYTAAYNLENLNLPIWELPGGPLMPELLAILYSRGFTDQQKAAAFLLPEYYSPTLPSELPNLDKAVRLLNKLRKGDTVLVWGDFDADGQTSTAMLVEALTTLGFQVPFYIPNRQVESHGVHIGPLRRLLDEHAPNLVIICDTGSSAVEEVEFIKAQDIPVIISDHHDIQPPLPRADALINPQLLRNPEHSLWTLSGAGVTYLLIEALFHSYGRKSDAERFLDLAAIGLIADVMQQVNDTRYLIQRGLRTLRRTERPGLHALCAQLDINLTEITSQDVGFSIAPALNAFGRLDTADKAVELLTAKETSYAQVLAGVADSLNQKRRHMTKQISEAAQQMIDDDPSVLDWDALVLSSPSWESGIIGIVAARLADQFKRPVALAVEGDDGVARGSVRSPVGFAVNSALSQLDDILLTYGGHEGAGGFSISMENLPILRRRLSQTLVDTRTSTEPPVLSIEGFLPIDRLTLDFALELQRLDPFGEGNPNPVFVTRDLEVQTIAQIGRTADHRRLIVQNSDGQRQQVFWWNSSDIEPPQGRFDLAYTVSVSSYQNEQQIQLQLVDWQPVEDEVSEKITTIEVVDYRQSDNIEGLLEDIHTADPMAEIWAEGFRTQETPGKPLGELKPANSLVILSSPPDGDILHKAIETVNPSRVYLVAMMPPIDSLPEFLKLLMGLCDRVIGKAGGTINIHRMMERTAQSRIVVQLGLEYLEALGKISVDFGERTRVDIQYGDGVQHNNLDVLEKRLKSAWEEVEAYRRFVERTDATQLIHSLI